MTEQLAAVRNLCSVHQQSALLAVHKHSGHILYILAADSPAQQAVHMHFAAVHMHLHLLTGRTHLLRPLNSYIDLHPPLSRFFLACAIT